MGTIKFQRFKSLETEDKPRRVTPELLLLALDYDKRHGTNKYEELRKRMAVELEEDLEELNRLFGIEVEDE